MPPKSKQATTKNKKTKQQEEDDEEFIAKDEEEDDIEEIVEDDDEDDMDYDINEKQSNKSAKAKKSPIAKKSSASSASSSRKAKPAASGATSSVPDIEECHNVNNYLYKDTTQLNTVRDNLLQWFNKHKRTLPWRKAYDHNASEQERSQRAYEVWVSEIMLQQTRVDTVMDYFKKWMIKFPTIEHLANASLEEVNQQWSGLGYYRRAKFLHEGAKKICSTEQVADSKTNEKYYSIPGTAQGLLKLPGIGKYTAGAISSIAFNQCEALVDGNVLRVLSRLRMIELDISNTKVVSNVFWPMAQSLVDSCKTMDDKDAQLYGDFNQSLMELGATVCTPKNPKCDTCPVKQSCMAQSKKQQDKRFDVQTLPIKKAKQKQAPQTVACVVFARQRRAANNNKQANVKDSSINVDDDADDNTNESHMLEYFFVKRPKDGLLANLWEFPQCIVDEGVEQEDALKELKQFCSSEARVANQFNDKTRDKSFKSLEFKDCGTVTHIFSHIRQVLLIYSAQLGDADTVVSGDNDEPTAVWMTEGEIATGALSKVMRKVFDQYKAAKSGKASAKKRGKKADSESSSEGNDGATRKKKQKKPATPAKGQQTLNLFLTKK